MNIFWITFSQHKYANFLASITAFNTQNKVFTPNPEMLLSAYNDPIFKSTLEKADSIIPDGIWLYIAFQINNSPHSALIDCLILPFYFFNLFFRRKMLYKKYWERICGSDITKDLLVYAQKNNITLTIIDPYFPQDRKKCESQEKFTQQLSDIFPELKFDFYIYKPEQKDNIIKQIKNSQSKILFSTLWMKRQEESVVEIMDKCYNIKLWLWVWSSFDYFTGFQKRAPSLFRAIGFEWLYRLITWPQKITRLRRLWNAIIVFIFTVLKEKHTKKREK